jgi:hypothetical protein
MVSDLFIFRVFCRIDDSGADRIGTRLNPRPSVFHAAILTLARLFLEKQQYAASQGLRLIKRHSQKNIAGKAQGP